MDNNAWTPMFLYSYQVGWEIVGWEIVPSDNITSSEKKDVSILDSIKGEKKLTLKHWRYRLLHWAFNVKNPEKPQDTGLPMFLYSHYCPLFHLTNLIAILSPLVLLMKIAAFVTWGCLAGTAWFLDHLPLAAVGKVFAVFAWMFPKRKELDWESPAPPPPTRFSERRMCLFYLYDFNSDFDFNFDFNYFWSKHSFRFKVLDRSEVALLFADFMLQAEMRRQRIKARREAWKKRIIFLANFSRVFIKVGMNGAYLALAGGLLYAAYKYGPTLISLWDGVCYAWNGVCYGAGRFGDFVVWLCTDSMSLAAAAALGISLLGGMSIVGILHGITRTRLPEYVGHKVGRGLYYASPVALVPARWVGNCFSGACEFVGMFYEENCPPIRIVKEEEETR